MRHTTPRSALAVTLSLAAGCAGDPLLGETSSELSKQPIEILGEDKVQVVPGIDPKTGGPIEVYRVMHDNPVVGGMFDMPWGHDVLAGVERKNRWAWLFDYFDIEVTYDDAEPLRDRAAWPAKAVAHSIDQQPDFPWEAHGMQLDPKGGAGEVRLFEDDWQNPNVTMVGAYVELDPEVMVVPITTLVLTGGPLNDPVYGQLPALSAARASADSTRLLFDDDWRHQKSINTAPGFSPEQVIGSWMYRPGCYAGMANCQAGLVASVDEGGGGGRHYQPDQVFDVCGVQFREVNYVTCQVPPKVLYNLDCNIGYYHNSMQAYLSKMCGLPEDAGDTLKVVFTGSISAPDCAGGETIGGQQAGWVYLAERAEENTLSHEIGHALGLAHYPQNGVVCSDPSNLMCAKNNDQALSLDSDQCTKAHGLAETRYHTYW